MCSNLPRMKNRRGIGWALVAAMSALVVGVAGTEAATTGTASRVPTTVPATLRALEAKMRALQVNSERFSQVSRGYIAVANEVNGKVVGPVKHVTSDLRQATETSLEPRMSETFVGARHAAALIVIGSTVYARTGRGRRRWTRRRDPELARSLASYPFHGDPAEVSFGGTGSYAALLNLLATATSPIDAGAPVTIEGRRTQEFSATVDPLLLVRGLTEEDLRNLRRHPLVEHLEIFLTDAGLPIEVVQRLRSTFIHTTTATVILAINTPVDVKAPPARETAGPAHRRHRDAGR